VEEMANNVIKHGFKKDKKPHSLSVRIVCKVDSLILRFRDNCRGFDPRKKYESIFGNEDPGRMIGIRMIMAGAEEVRYTSMLDLNNLIIIIRKNREQEKQSGPSGEQK
jgi:anti-sigma regulatory factor (Ser/Thr protein kinase)